MLFGSWHALLRILVAGVLAYVALVVLLRVSGKRTLTKMNAFDFVVTVALGSSLATVLLSKTTAVIDGVLAFAVLIGLQYAVAWGSTRWRLLERAVKAPPTLLYWRGDFLRDALRRERFTETELRAALREQGLGSFDDVEAVILEAAGDLSVIRSVREGRSTLGDVEGAERHH